MLHFVVTLSYLLGAYAQTVSAPALVMAHELIRRQSTNTGFIGYRKSGTSCRLLDKRLCGYN
jgi:hypothetical protein